MKYYLKRKFLHDNNVKMRVIRHINDVEENCEREGYQTRFFQSIVIFEMELAKNTTT